MQKILRLKMMSRLKNQQSPRTGTTRLVVLCCILMMYSVIWSILPQSQTAQANTGAISVVADKRVRRTVTPAQLATPALGSLRRQNNACSNMTLRKARAGELGNYFYNGCNQPVLLIGSHTWSNPQDYVSSVQFKPFVLNDWLSMLVANGHNYSRGWVWDSPKATTPGPSVDDYVATPTVWVRSNVCCAADGGNKFDLNQVNPVYLSRLKSAIEAYGSRNIYFSVMLFNGWSTFTHLDGREVWKYHPFNGGNNINGLSIPDTKAHIYNSPSWPYQEKYIRAVIAAVDRYNNVFYEISNEDSGTVEWENQIVDLVHSLSSKPIGHGTTNFNKSRSDWWSIENGNAEYTRSDRVIMSDTDHLTYGDIKWLETAYELKHNPALMEWWNQDENNDPNAVSPWYTDETVNAIRKRMGELRQQFESTRPATQCCSYVFLPITRSEASGVRVTR